MQALRSVPEQGQLAVVRQRRYVVTDVRLGATNAQLGERPQHLISLASIEDDALGEELQVIWEIEPGARAFEKMELPQPKGFDQPAHLEAFLDAVRWGAASIADTRQLQSPFRSGIEIESYQLDPVVRTDPVTFAGLPLLLLLVSAWSAYFAHSEGVDPLIALRPYNTPL